MAVMEQYHKYIKHTYALYRVFTRYHTERFWVTRQHQRFKKCHSNIWHPYVIDQMENVTSMRPLDMPARFRKYKHVQMYFRWIKIFDFKGKNSHRIVFLRGQLTRIQHRFMQWLCAEDTNSPTWSVGDHFDDANIVWVNYLHIYYTKQHAVNE